MSDCCTPHTNESSKPMAQDADCRAATAGRAVDQSETVQIQHCPACGRKGKKVGMETVKAMLAVTLHAIQPARTYLFCRTADCAVVYFADDGQQTFAEQELREQVHQKHSDDDDVFVCYCFRHTPGSIRAELLATGQSTVVETVTQGTRVHQCACEIRNPQGSCCLGNVAATVKRMQVALTPLAGENR